MAPYKPPYPAELNISQISFSPPQAEFQIWTGWIYKLQELK